MCLKGAFDGIIKGEFDPSQYFLNDKKILTCPEDEKKFPFNIKKVDQLSKNFEILKHVCKATEFKPKKPPMIPKIKMDNIFEKSVEIPKTQRHSTKNIFKNRSSSKGHLLQP